MKAAVQEIVNKIYLESGSVTPSGLVEAARPKNSPIHNAFEWDNAKAAAEYRLVQARYWLRRVTVTVDGSPERLVRVPVFNAVANSPAIGEGLYKPVTAMLQNEFEAALGDAIERLKSARDAVDELRVIASKKQTKKIPNFAMAETGFGMVDRALTGASASA